MHLSFHSRAERRLKDSPQRPFISRYLPTSPGALTLSKMEKDAITVTLSNEKPVTILAAATSPSAFKQDSTGSKLV